MVIRDSSVLYIGSTPVLRIYAGNVVVWDASPQDGYYAPDGETYYVAPDGNTYYAQYTPPPPPPPGFPLNFEITLK